MAGSPGFGLMVHGDEDSRVALPERVLAGPFFVSRQANQEMVAALAELSDAAPADGLLDAIEALAGRVDE